MKTTVFDMCNWVGADGISREITRDVHFYVYRKRRENKVRTVMCIYNVVTCVQILNKQCNRAVITIGCRRNVNFMIYEVHDRLAGRTSLGDSPPVGRQQYGSKTVRAVIEIGPTDTVAVFTNFFYTTTCHY